MGYTWERLGFDVMQSLGGADMGSDDGVLWPTFS
jgi:hypothetical protein